MIKRGYFWSFEFVQGWYSGTRLVIKDPGANLQEPSCLSVSYSSGARPLTSMDGSSNPAMIHL